MGVSTLQKKAMVVAVAALLASGGAANAQLASQGMGPGEGVASPQDFAPPGTLYDNDVSDMTTSLASQNSSGTFLARSADDFTIDSAGCASGVFDITAVRIQMVQSDAAPQAFGIEFYGDNGSGTAPTPADSIVPIAAFTETGQTNLGVFGVGTSLFEASFSTAGLQIAGDTVYWISGFGSNAAANPSGFNNFFASSAGAPSTTANGVIIAPNAGVATWTPVESVIGPPALHFAFAIDGQCATLNEIPTLGPWGLAALSALLGLFGLTILRRRVG